MLEWIKRVRDRLTDRTKCIKCQKDLVGDEKYLCGRCRMELGIAGGASLGAIILAVALYFLKESTSD